MDNHELRCTLKKVAQKKRCNNRKKLDKDLILSNIYIKYQVGLPAVMLRPPETPSTEGSAYGLTNF